MDYPLLHQALWQLDSRQFDRPAIKSKSGVLTYGQLREKAIAVAEWLVENGCGRGDRVVICLPKCSEYVELIFGVLFAGSAYVPVDSAAPTSRISTIIGDAAPRRVFTTKKLHAQIDAHVKPSLRPMISCIEDLDIGGRVFGSPDTVPDSLQLNAASASDLAVILYTSGSTGVPKGVMLSHQNVASFVDWVIDTFAIDQNDRLLSHAPFHFDLSTVDLFATVATGASVYLLDDITVKFPSAMSKVMEQERTTVCYAVPTAFRLLLEHGALDRRDLSHLRLILFAGEVFPVPSLKKVMDVIKSAEFANLYGPAETNVCTYYKLPKKLDPDVLEIPIGVPCEHLEVFILDDAGNVISGSEIGEICVVGPAVMLGYWRRPELTSRSRYKDNEKSYRTGDFGAWMDDGNMRFAGRRDAQIKIHGHRVELSEIESVLVANSGIKEAAVTFVKTEKIEAKLFGFVVPEGNAKLTVSAVLQHCSKYLPPYAVPHEVVIKDDFPRTSTGKIDRQLLLDLSKQLVSGEL